jgi:hypothetical protein
MKYPKQMKSNKKAPPGNSTAKKPAIVAKAAPKAKASSPRAPAKKQPTAAVKAHGKVKATNSPRPLPSTKTVPPMNTKRPGGRPNDLSWHDRYLVAYAKFGTIKDACKAAGINRHTYEAHRAKFPDFDQECAVVDVECADEADRELFLRAVRGWQEPVYQGGELVGTILVKSDRLLEFFLKHRRPEIYGDKTKIELSGAVEMTVAEELKMGASAVEGILLTIGASVPGAKT